MAGWGARPSRAMPHQEQHFVKIFQNREGFDRKFRGEILKFEERNLEDFPPKFAVKLRGILNWLIINTLQIDYKSAYFVKIFHNFYS